MGYFVRHAETHDESCQAAMPSPITLTYLGHSACRLTHESHDILIDPFITGNPLAEGAGIRSKDLEPTHLILTHAHGDHLGDTVAIATRTNATVIATFELAEYLAARGCRTEAMGIGGEIALGFGRVKLTIAHHSSSTPDGVYAGNPAGVLLFIDGRTIYHAGDTALFLDMKLIGERHPITLAMVPIGDRFTMGVDDAITAVEFLGPRQAMPIHFNTWPPIMVDSSAFARGVEALGVAPVVLEAGESITI